MNITLIVQQIAELAEQKQKDSLKKEKKSLLQSLFSSTEDDLREELVKSSRHTGYMNGLKDALDIIVKNIEKEK